MKIKSFQGGFDKNFCYLLWCDETKFAAIVDPSVNITPVIEFIERSNLILSKILITHTHHDHILYLNEYIHFALSLGLMGGDPKSITIGIGMWLGIIMAYNVWMVIWPNQKKALGIIVVDVDEKTKSARTAMLFSRTNTLLSIPMLLSMVFAQNLA